MAEATTYCPGLDPLALIRTDSDIEFALLEKVVARAAKLQQNIRKEQATLIINALATSLSKGGRSRGDSTTSTH